MTETFETSSVPDERNAWRGRPALQQPKYEDYQELNQVTSDLKTRPPLVFAGEVDKLSRSLAAAAEGKSFILTGGDCAETFVGSTADKIRAKIQTILQMSVVISYGASMPVVKIGRIAGQYSKPRSSDLETRNGISLPSYRGDAVNGFGFTAEERRPDPHRLMEMYQRSATSLNLIRAFTRGGYADLRQVHNWNRGFTDNPAYARYENLAGEIDRALRFMEAVGSDFEAISFVDLYSAHEALLLEYEDAMTRVDSRTGDLYNTSAHYLWIGERTRQLDGAHVQQCASVRNPIGVKLGPTATAEDVIALSKVINPNNEIGRLSLITRMGAKQIYERLPQLVREVKAAGIPVLWICDPMHGNTVTSGTGYKTRRFDDIMNEVAAFFEIVVNEGAIPGGIHVELTGDDVTEVLGGAEELTEDALADNYETLVDPRLNHQQSLELAFLVAQMLGKC
ncbi:3-deoxy-7-phosphoheptulonate synthase [Boudabousia liubingyangii]|uniref:class II 3-deoxy-7-phosphoheptulonate synthase n=1 Tax=Boudabousia liubingyangii TaxID=1921764 RepID=UPI00093CB7FF|nr:3-deoxy-7-phosphoheptulonate synthase class II [Boudabousia liubingyangii]OKL47750.1 3-deoxy-7-phosphoheptulonate synthase [Boudabousia liubingyangii]